MALKLKKQSEDSSDEFLDQMKQLIGSYASKQLEEAIAKQSNSLSVGKYDLAGNIDHCPASVLEKVRSDESDIDFYEALEDTEKALIARVEDLNSEIEDVIGVDTSDELDFAIKHSKNVFTEAYRAMKVLGDSVYNDFDNDEIEAAELDIRAIIKNIEDAALNLDSTQFLKSNEDKVLFGKIAKPLRRQTYIICLLTGGNISQPSD